MHSNRTLRPCSAWRTHLAAEGVGNPTRDPAPSYDPSCIYTSWRGTHVHNAAHMLLPAHVMAPQGLHCLSSSAAFELEARRNCSWNFRMKIRKESLQL